MMPAFSAGDRGQRVAQQLAMIERDRGDRARRRPFDHVGGVAAAAEPHFQHAQVGRRRGEQVEGDGGDHLEHGDRRTGVHPLHMLQRRRQSVASDTSSPAMRMRSLNRTRCGEV